MKPIAHILAAVVLTTSSFACNDTEADRGGSNDAGVDASADVASDAVSEDAATDTSDSLASTCEGACRQQSLSVDFGGTAGTIERAVYGLTAPQVSGSGEWEVYIEALEGGFDGCPAQDSPTPAWTLILNGLPASLEASTLTKSDDGLAATFLDYDGRFLGQEPFSRATEVTVTPAAANFDTELVAQGADDEDGIVALEVNARFDGGSVTGHLVATHCASMDESGMQ